MSETSLSPIAGAACPTPAGTDGATTARTADNQAIKQKAVAAKDAVASLAGEAKRYASHRVTDAKDKAGEWVDTAKSKASDYSDDVVDYVQRNPFTAIAIAAGIGFVAGLILKRR
jgi:ElaB/YqjD/DUF883 family membrane-anchored ribosome-binding protein